MKIEVHFSQSKAHKLQNFLGPPCRNHGAASLDGNLSSLNIYVRITALGRGLLSPSSPHIPEQPQETNSLNDQELG